MKKIAIWSAVISIMIFIITWGIIGVKILNNDYEFMTEAYIAYGSLVIFFTCLIYARCTYRCQHCGKQKIIFGNYCPYCGKKIR